jgi:hypothetical protein
VLLRRIGGVRFHGDFVRDIDRIFSVWVFDVSE